MNRPKILTREQARELDRRAVEEFGVPSILLMENAARACADEAERHLRIEGVSRAMADLRKPGSKDDIPRNVEELERWKSKLRTLSEPVVILCGPGNNGGDGLAIARTLFNRGHAVKVCYVGAKSKLEKASEDVKTNLRLLSDLDIDVEEISNHDHVKEAERIFAGSPLIIDAIFGTGLTRRVEDPFMDVIQRANDSGTSILSVDIPSGLDANTGDVFGISIRAESTVTFIAQKPGFLEGAGPSFCGAITVAEIGIPRVLIEDALKV